MTPLQITREALDAALDIEVCTIKPTSKPASGKYVVLSRIGSTTPTFGTQISRFLIECFAPTPLKAEQLGEEVHTAWLNLRGGKIHWIDSDHNLAPYDMSSPGDPGAVGQAGERRYQFTGSVQFLI